MDRKTVPEKEQGQSETVLDSDKSMWRRFELTSTGIEHKHELDNLLAVLDISRYELALIVSSLRVRHGFSLEDFQV